MYPSRQLKHPVASGLQSKTNQEGIIVWDPKGVVIMWQDGHRSRFFWQELRANCVCEDCQTQKSSHAKHLERKAA